MAAKGHVFISYARADAAFALRLGADLKSKGANVWLDQLDIRPGQQWDREIELAVTAASALLVILSPAAVDSNNVMDEVAFALDEHKTVIPAVCADCRIPIRLRRIQYIDFRSDYDNGLKGLIGALAAEDQISTPGTDVLPSKPGIAREPVPDRLSPPKHPPKTGRLSYWKAAGSHPLLGFGLFYVDTGLRRRWFYPIFPLYAIFDLFMAYLRVEPFESSSFGGTTFFVSLGIYALSFIDVMVTCRSRRRLYSGS